MSEKTIYPAYINKSRTVAKGRRIAIEYAVTDPKPNEIIDALLNLKGFQARSEPKAYTRETDKEAVPWRVRYENVDPSKNNLTKKREVLLACAKRINFVRSKSASSGLTKKKSKSKSKSQNDN